MQKPRILLLANNIVGLEVAKFLKKNKENIVGLGIHDKHEQKFIKEIIKIVNLPKSLTFNGKHLRDPLVIKKIQRLKPDIIIAAFWGYILKPEIFTIPRYGTINFHPAYLPFNQGKNPNVWPIIENTPAGVTLHYIDENIDSGDIIARKKIEVEPVDTAETLYKKTLVEIVTLFKQSWPKIKNGKMKRTAQKSLRDKPTFHWGKDIDKLDYIKIDKSYKARDLINIIRARSYKNRYFAYYMDHGKKVYVRLELSYKES